MILKKEITLNFLRIRNMLRVILCIAKKHCFRYAFHYVISCRKTTSQKREIVVDDDTKIVNGRIAPIPLLDMGIPEPEPEPFQNTLRAPLKI
jgi:hypothetical protein